MDTRTIVKRWGVGLVFVAVVALLIAGVGAGGTQAQTNLLVWAQWGGAPGNSSLADVFMIDENNAWAVGSEQAYELDWNGARWNVTSRGTFRAWLTAVVAISDENVWAVGDNGLIVHRDATGWHEMPNPVPDASLLTLQMFSNGEEGWAGGGSSQGSVLLHYKDGSWQRDASFNAPNSGPITGLHFAAGGGWAVNSNSIWRYANGSWHREPEPSPCPDTQCYSYLQGVRAISDAEAWAVGSRQGSCALCLPVHYVIHRVNGSWQRVVPDQSVLNDPAPPPTQSNLKKAAFTSNDFGFAVGVHFKDNASHPLILSYRNGVWQGETQPVIYGDLNSVSAFNSTHALAVGFNGLILSYGYGPTEPLPFPTATPTATPYPTVLPTERVGDPRHFAPEMMYFPLVGHILRGGFQTYWLAHGGLSQFGYPLTEEFDEISPTDGLTYTVQYFERARFEWHPLNRFPYDVLLGLLGNTVTSSRRSEPPFQPASANNNQPGYLYFPPTRHNMAPQFVDYWRTHGGLPVYGYPISEPFTETSQADGKPYLVQYFERNRLEYHPELPAAYRVSLGLLGAEVLKARGWLP